MTGTLVVLVIGLIVPLLVRLVALAATFFLAKRNGQRLKSMSWSPVHGFTAEFFDSEEPQSGPN
ncbi:MAG: hypothetical protein LC808_33350 [Actinobacteria bacterium]|nr:hypothetical protein [Actinomycetota bacterium]